MATTTRTKAAQRFLTDVEQSWDTRAHYEQTAAHGLSETDADALAAICGETGDDLATATADVLAAVRAKLAETAGSDDEYRLVETGSGCAVERTSDGALAEFLDRDEAHEALAYLLSGYCGDSEYEWQARD